MTGLNTRYDDILRTATYTSSVAHNSPDCPPPKSSENKE